MSAFFGAIVCDAGSVFIIIHNAAWGADVQNAGSEVVRNLLTFKFRGEGNTCKCMMSSYK